MNRIRITTAATVILASLALGGCNNNQHVDPAVGNATIAIDAASREFRVGDTATFIARTNDTYGRDAQVRWSSPVGNLTTDQEGRVARIKFTEAGTFSVTSTLEIDGRPVKSDMIDVRVLPVQ